MSYQKLQEKNSRGKMQNLQFKEIGAPMVITTTIIIDSITTPIITKEVKNKIDLFNSKEKENIIKEIGIRIRINNLILE
jgi:polygalacturonase